MQGFEWVKDLKVGDEVIVDRSNFYRGKCYQLCEVEKITPTGRINLSNGRKYHQTGKEIGTYDYPLLQVTQELLDKIKTRNLLNEIKSVDMELLSLEQIEAIHKICFKKGE